jgi:hypothetical protein
MHGARTLRRLVAGAMSVSIALAGTCAAPASVAAAGPPEQAAASFLAGRDGGQPSDYLLIYAREAIVPGSGERLWAGKMRNTTSGQISLVYRTKGGVSGGPELLSEERASAAPVDAFGRKASQALRTAVAAAAAGGGALPVAIWLHADLGRAAGAVMATHPHVTWLGDRPLVNDLDAVRSLRAEMWTARRDAIASAAEGLRSEVKRLGGRVAYLSTSAPVMFVDLPAAAAYGLARRPDVDHLGLEGVSAPALANADPALEANWTGGSEDQGNGIRVAVVEYHNVRTGGDLAGRVVASHSTTGKLAYASGFDHPTWVAGAVSSQNGTFKGVAPGALIVSSGTGGYTPSLAYDRAIIAAADWAISPSGGDADIVNTSLVQDTATGSEEARRYFDAVVAQDGRLSVSAAGNYVNFNNWLVGSPGTGYNVLTVGGVDDHGTPTRSDDRIWYQPGSNGSNWVDSPGTAWNTHGDFNKPNLVAPAAGVRTANGLAASGTSVATPLVAGVAAQVMANEPLLVAWPEGLRAVLMAGAVHRVPMPDGSVNADHEGVGMISALWSNRVASQGDHTLGGYDVGVLRRGDEPVQDVTVRAGDRLRVALAWNSHTSGSGNLNLTDSLLADLDLVVTDPNGNVTGSYTIDNSYEFVEVVMPSSGTAHLEVRQSRFDGSSETYGLAWAKVRDTTAPKISGRVPNPGEPWAVPSAQVRVTFDEAVTGVSGSTLKLKRLSTGEFVSAKVTYQSSSRTALLTPRSDLPPGKYKVLARSGITDLAGNALPGTAWRFSVKRPGAATSTRYTNPRRILLSAGTHTGYTFDGSGNVTGSRTETLARSSGAGVDRRASLTGVPGVWLHVTNGIWAGYWIRESGGSGLGGRVGTRHWSATKHVSFSAGTYTGYRFDQSGKVTGSQAFTLGSASGADADARAVINGGRYLHIVNGVWAGYWVPESASVHVAGIFDLADLHGARATMGAGTRTAYCYDATGGVRGSRTMRLSRRSGAPVAAWAIINGVPAFYVQSGGWGGYWLAESAAVHVP